MIPALLLPAGLAALAALLLPLLIHLARREDRRPVDFAALRWLSQRARPRRRLRFEDRRLLAVRLLLLFLVALLLARPALPPGDDARPWIVALPGLGAEALAVDAPPDAERRWLAPGFPAMAADSPPPPQPQPTTSLLRELDMHMPPGAALVVLVPPVLDGVDAERPSLSRPVDWRVVDTPAANDGPPDASSAPVVEAPAPRLVIADAGSDAGAGYLRAVEAAWRSLDEVDDTRPVTGLRSGNPSGRVLASEAVHREPDLAPDTPHTADRLEVRAWLAAGPLPAEVSAWIEAGGTALLAQHTLLPALDDAPVLWSDDDGRPLLRGATLGAGRALQWTRPLQSQAMPLLLDAGFPQRLREVLQPAPPPARVLAAEHAPLHADPVVPWPRPWRSLSSWLALAIAFTFLLERWLATGARRERQA